MGCQGCGKNDQYSAILDYLSLDGETDMGDMTPIEQSQLAQTILARVVDWPAPKHRAVFAMCLGSELRGEADELDALMPGKTVEQKAKILDTVRSFLPTPERGASFRQKMEEARARAGAASEPQPRP